jgi:solute:Na+ symporter, SSS family
MDLTLSGLLVLSVTLAFFAWTGLRVRGADAGLDDYVTARGSQRGRALGLSFFASGMGAWILFAPPEVGAFVGLVAVAGYAIGAAGPFVAFGLLGPRVRRVMPSGHSLTEFVRVRYGRAFRTYVFAISVLYMFFFVTAELSAVGAVGAITAGLDPRTTIIAVVAVTLAYTAYGGLRASLATDRWQAWLVLVMLAVGAVAVLMTVDAPASAIVQAEVLGVGRLGFEAAVALVIAVTTANLFHQGYWQRLWAARDPASLARGAAVGAGLTLPVIALIGALGALAVASGAELGDPPAPFFALAAGIGGAMALVVLGLGIALVASSVDTLENALASLVVSERPATSLHGARLITIGVMVPALLLALQGHSVLRLFLIADLFCAATVVPALLGLWRRATTTGALTGSVAGLAAAIVPGWVSAGSFLEGVRAATFPDAVPTLPPFAAALVASSMVAVTVSLVTRDEGDLDALDEQVPVLR